MAELSVVHLSDLIEQGRDELIENIILDFKCPMNQDIELFLKKSAVEFSKQRIAATYLVFTEHQKHHVMVGYFSIAQKYFHIEADSLSKTQRRKINKFASYEKKMDCYIVSAMLLGQFGKNYAHGYHRLVDGSELLALACHVIGEIQRASSGKLVYLECEEKEALLSFYRKNNFVAFHARSLEGQEAEHTSAKCLIQMFKYL